MNFKTPRNPNYAATVVRLNTFIDLANCDNVKHALIYGNSVIVAKNAPVGEMGIFFPVETQLSKEFLGANNLYAKPEYGNIDPNKKGYFTEQGRVKAVRFRGHKSEGFWIPVHSLAFTGINPAALTEGDTFDFIGDIEICRKYIIRTSGNGANKTRAKVARLEDSIVDNQFRFHFDTENLRKNISKLRVTETISISSKWHGTSAVFANVLVKRKLSFLERLVRRVGVRVQETEYGLTHSSRRVVKGIAGVDKSNAVHFYGSDVWGVVAKEIADRLPKSYTVYGEIVGYTPDGKAIQAAPGGKAYHYGCAHGMHKFLVYRVTTTNPDGKVLDLPWRTMMEFCSKYGFEPVKELYYGPITDLIPWDSTMDIRDWQQNVLTYLEKTYVNDSMCPYNNNEVPEEGIVVRIDSLEECISFKLKNFLFLEAETKLNDAGVLDIETSESTTEEE